MIARERSDDDHSDAEHYGGPPPSQRTTRSHGGCCERPRQADRSVLVHGLSAAVVALIALRVLPAAVCLLVGLCGLLLGLNGGGGGGHRRRSAEPGGIGPEDGGRSVPSAPPVVPLMSGLTLSAIKRGIGVLTGMMRRVQRSVVRPKRSRRSSRRCRDGDTTASTTITTCTRTVETVKGSRDGNGYVQCSERRYRTYTARERQR